MFAPRGQIITMPQGVCTLFRSAGSCFACGHAHTGKLVNWQPGWREFAEDWSEKNEVFAYFNLNFNCCRGGWINNAISIILKNNNGKGPAKLLIFEYNM